VAGRQDLEGPDLDEVVEGFGNGSAVFGPNPVSRAGAHDGAGGKGHAPQGGLDRPFAGPADVAVLDSGVPDAVQDAAPLDGR
jgi:hypothetical protein